MLNDGIKGLAILPGSGRLVSYAAYPMTGVRNVGVRSGFSEYDIWGGVEGVRSGLAMAVPDGPLDAPDQLASGAVKGYISRRYCTAGPVVLHVAPTYCARENTYY